VHWEKTNSPTPQTAERVRLGFQKKANLLAKLLASRTKWGSKRRGWTFENSGGRKENHRNQRTRGQRRRRSGWRKSKTATKKTGHRRPIGSLDGWPRLRVNVPNTETAAQVVGEKKPNQSAALNHEMLI